MAQNGHDMLKSPKTCPTLLCFTRRPIPFPSFSTQTRCVQMHKGAFVKEKGAFVFVKMEDFSKKTIAHFYVIFKTTFYCELKSTKTHVLLIEHNWESLGNYSILSSYYEKTHQIKCRYKLCGLFFN
jgi:hypothetical protein